MQLLRTSVRLVAVIVFLSISLAPVYYKYVTKKEAESPAIQLKQHSLTNITNVHYNEQKYICSEGPHIPIIKEKGKIIKILHFTSPSCKYCVTNALDWGNFPLMLYEKIKDKKIDILHILNTGDVNAHNIETFVHNLMTLEDTKVTAKDIVENELSVCVAVMQKEAINKMAISIRPYIAVIKMENGNHSILYHHAGDINSKDFENIIEAIVEDDNKK